VIASLPMYDTGATRDANDRFWSLIRAAYGRGPEHLDRTTDPHATWENKGLVLSQTCGLPYRSGLYRSVQLVGTPDYGVAGCPPGFYCSCLVVPAGSADKPIGDLATARLARNDARSQSGWAAFAEHMQENGTPFSGTITDTGSHSASVMAVAQGAADIAAIDAVTWALLERDTQNTRGLKVLCRTRPTPGLPLICGPQEDAAALREAIRDAIEALDAQDRACLQINGLVQIAAEDYLRVPLP
jgi:ABC-type phosphate/phosphonate transport system substrate-binding protein